MNLKTNDKNNLIILENEYKHLRDQIILSAKINRVYAYKLSAEIINTKITNQINSTKYSINKINPKFFEKHKNYKKVSDELELILESFEEVLKQLCDEYDNKIEECILEKIKLESDLLMCILAKNNLYVQEDKKIDKKRIINGISNTVEKIKSKMKKSEQLDISLINRLQDGQEIENELYNINNQSEEYKSKERQIRKLEKEIKKINKKISNLNEEKKERVFAAMETQNTSISTEIKKPRTFKSIKKFFVNRFNTYNVIMKKVIEPIKQRIDEFKVNELKKIDGTSQEFNFSEFDNKVKKTQNDILDNIENKIIKKKLGII